MQQENLQLLSKRMGNLSIPVPLLGPVAAYALFADRLLGQTAMRYRTGLPACWTSAPSCWPSSTSCRPRPPTTESWWTPGQAPSA
jgi:hypothetical protein